MNPSTPLFFLLFAASTASSSLSNVQQPQDPPPADAVISLEEQCASRTVPLGKSGVGPMGAMPFEAVAEFMVYRETSLAADGQLRASGKPVLAVSIQYRMGPAASGEARRLHLTVEDVESISRGLATLERLRFDRPEGVASVLATLSHSGWTVRGGRAMSVFVITDSTLGDLWVDLAEVDKVRDAFRAAGESMRRLEPLGLGVSIAK